VENEEQMSQLRLLGCDRIQGFLFKRPLPAAQATEYLRSMEGLWDEVA
jgi:EAL domain-containing protein (putative c-di-GMP-specific phosphodiesterase class I)